MINTIQPTIPETKHSLTAKNILNTTQPQLCIANAIPLTFSEIADNTDILLHPETLWLA